MHSAACRVANAEQPLGTTRKMQTRQIAASPGRADSWENLQNLSRNRALLCAARSWKPEPGGKERQDRHTEKLGSGGRDSPMEKPRAYYTQVNRKVGLLHTVEQGGRFSQSPWG